MIYLLMVAIVFISVTTAFIYDKIVNAPCKWHTWDFDKRINRYRCEKCNVVCF